MWGNPALFHREKSVEKNMKNINIDLINGEKSFLIDLPTANDAIYRDSLILISK